MPDIFYSINLKPKFLSWEVQNEILDLLAIGLCRVLCKTVRASKLYNLLLDHRRYEKFSVLRYDIIGYHIVYGMYAYSSTVCRNKRIVLEFFEIKYRVADYKSQLYSVSVRSQREAPAPPARSVV